METEITQTETAAQIAHLPHRIDAVVGGSSDDPYGPAGAIRYRLTLLAWPGRGDGGWTWYRDTAEECATLVASWIAAAAEGRLGVCPGDVIPPLDLRRVRSLRLILEHRPAVLRALTAALEPYGSINAEVPQLLLEWVSGPDEVPLQPHSIQVAYRLVDTIRGVDCDQCSDLTLGDYSASVRTPSSGTLISVLRFAGGWTVEVDFGEHGSHHRADVLCDGPHPWEVLLVDGTRLERAQAS